MSSLHLRVLTEHPTATVFRPGPGSVASGLIALRSAFTESGPPSEELIVRMTAGQLLGLIWQEAVNFDQEHNVEFMCSVVNVPLLEPQMSRLPLEKRFCAPHQLLLIGCRKGGPAMGRRPFCYFQFGRAAIDSNVPRLNYTHHGLFEFHGVTTRVVLCRESADLAAGVARMVRSEAAELFDLTTTFMAQQTAKRKPVSLQSIKL